MPEDASPTDAEARSCSFHEPHARPAQPAQGRCRASRRDVSSSRVAWLGRECRRRQALPGGAPRPAPRPCQGRARGAAGR
ncbi:hypothetical protein ACFPRL_31670 [Pseudoclavibacter helvolus]